MSWGRQTTSCCGNTDNRAGKASKEKAPDPGLLYPALPAPSVPEIQAKSITLPNYRTINNHGVKRVHRWQRYRDNPLQINSSLLPLLSLILFPYTLDVDDSSAFLIPYAPVSACSIVRDLGPSLRICDPGCSRHPASTMVDLDREIFISWLSNHLRGRETRTFRNPLLFHLQIVSPIGVTHPWIAQASNISYSFFFPFFFFSPEKDILSISLWMKVFFSIVWHSGLLGIFHDKPV